ncbi:uncharacterized protein NEMAJ01_0059 [Nematocida major]|uniref:uncharacterized protein n=1 Tax=Nematocida major TaxID=1912982 RepID=UPI002007E4F5|nr:uncharacterized protein NEMAJ01_0059 [Nematocida major]KAH9385163.1 hypothetical protein NEMAJ01_0059 [Nematocida major]
MQAAIKREIGESVSSKEIEEFFKRLFPIGDPSKIVEMFTASLMDKSPEGVYELILTCRNSKREFARWVYKCVTLAQSAEKEGAEGLSCGGIKNAANALSENLSNMTGISSSPCTGLPESESEFIDMCLASERFQKSWSVLRLCSF